MKHDHHNASSSVFPIVPYKPSLDNWAPYESLYPRSPNSHADSALLRDRRLVAPFIAARSALNARGCISVRRRRQGYSAIPTLDISCVRAIDLCFSHNGEPHTYIYIYIVCNAHGASLNESRARARAVTYAGEVPHVSVCLSVDRCVRARRFVYVHARLTTACGAL